MVDGITPCLLQEIHVCFPFHRLLKISRLRNRSENQWDLQPNGIGRGPLNDIVWALLRTRWRPRRGSLLVICLSRMVHLLMHEEDSGLTSTATCFYLFPSLSCLNLMEGKCLHRLIVTNGASHAWGQRINERSKVRLSIFTTFVLSKNVFFRIRFLKN